MIICDLCNKEIKNVRIVPPEYRTDDLREICSDCDIILHEKVGKIESISKKTKQTNVKKVIEEMKK